MVEGSFTGKPLTEKGEALTKAVENFLTDADGKAKVEDREKAIRDIVEKLPYTDLSLEGWGRKITWKVSILLYGKNFINHVWHAEPVHLYVRPASAMISRITTQDTAYSVTAAGIPVCILTSQ